MVDQLLESPSGTSAAGESPRRPRTALWTAIAVGVLVAILAGREILQFAYGAEYALSKARMKVGRAEDAGIVVTEKVGPTRLVRANPDHPLFNAVSQVVLSTFGPPAVIAREFEGLVGAEAVLLFGSWAARYLGQSGRAPKDIDVLVIGSPDRDAVDDAAERAERTIGLPVQATVRSRSQWTGARDSFIREVKRRPFVIVLADDDLVEELPGDARGHEVST